MKTILEDTYELIRLECDCGVSRDYPNIQGITYYPVCDKCGTQHNEYTCNGSAKRYRLQPETIQLWNDIIEILDNYKEQIGVRQLFYQLVKSGWPKTEKFSNRVIAETSKMRKRGVIPFDSFSDSTRTYFKQKSYSGMDEFQKYWQANYRKAIWFDMDFLVEVWIEKQGLVNTIFSVTNEFDVPVMPCRGFASLSTLYNVAKKSEVTGKAIFILYLGDYDPSGELISDTIRNTLREFETNVIVRRIAINKNQIELYDLPTRPTKDSNHSKHFESGQSVELDSMDPDDLRELLRVHINSFIPEDVINGIRKVEEVEKQTFANANIIK